MATESKLEGMRAEAGPSIAGHVVISGGYESFKALESFFSAASELTGVCYFVCAELPLRQSIHVYEHLKKIGGLPVYAIDSTMILEPDAIYLCPSFSNISIIDKKLTVNAVRGQARNRNTLNLLIEALEEMAPRSALVSVAGYALPDSKALARFRAKGGLVIEEAQGADEEKTEYRVADQVLPVGDMASSIREHFGLGEGPLSLDERRELESLRHLFDRLTTRVRIDFTQYKTEPLKRRILNRMRRSECTDIAAYVRFASEDSRESLALYDDFIVGVTRFFRDEKAFDRLREKVIPALFKRHKDGSEIRIWVPGVASGEEAYSIAMLMEECAMELGIESPHYKIFASDAHEVALGKGVKAVYSQESVRHLSPERIERFFIRTKRHFQIKPQYRKKVVFARHDLLTDPPFSRIDLVSCRNLLIYLKPSAQKKAFGMMLFSLQLRGFLFLGASESPNSYIGQLDSVDIVSRIYSKVSDTYVSPTMLDAAKPKLPKLSSFDRPNPLKVNEHPEQVMLNGVMERYMPPSIIIDDIGEIVHTFGECDAFMVPMVGRVSLHFEDRLLPFLRVTVQHARARALAGGVRVQCRCQRQEGDETFSSVDIEAEGLKSFHGFESCVLVVFNPEKRAHSPEQRSVALDLKKTRESVTELNLELTLRQELKLARAQLSETVEQLEESNQELQLANEELLTSNEELQTTNEELHSVNEELFSVNAEYESKNRDLISLNEDINNLLSSTEIGTVFIGTNLRIRKFTPAANVILNLLPSDIGRPIDHISHNLVGYDSLVEDTKTVIAEGKGLEKEASMAGGALLLVRILPFKTEKEEVTGAVIALIDVTELKRAETQVLDSQRRLQLALEAAEFGVWSFDLERSSFECDPRVERLLDFRGDREEAREEFLAMIDTTIDSLARVDQRSDDLQDNAFQESWDFTAIDGQMHYLSTRAIVYRGPSGRIHRVSGIMWDETETKRGEQQVLQKKKDLETLLYVVSHDLREPLRAIQSFSALLDERYGDELEGKAADFLRRIQAASNRMTALLDDVLSLSRINKMQTPMERVDGAELVQAAMKELEKRIQDTDAKIVVSSDLPELRANYTYAKQALTNLIGNALKFVNPGEKPDIEITPHVSKSDHIVGVEVRDRGPGIPEESLGRVFKLFQRAVGRDVEGTGAGLAIVKQIAQKHGGDVWYEPRSGGGAKFTITFSRNL